MIHYSRFCCRIAITEDGAPADTEALAYEDADIRERRARFARERLSPVSDWFRESPALLAHIRALRIGHHSAPGATPGERFIDTAAACVYTGRARQVLYRWATERRITRYGEPGEMALWDVLELPGKGRNGEPGAAPPRKG